MVKCFLFLFIFASSLFAQSPTATKEYVDRKDELKRDKSDLTVYSDKLSDFFGVEKWKVAVNHSIYGKIEGVTYTRYIKGSAVYWDNENNSFSLVSSDGTNITFNSIVRIDTTFSNLKGANEDVSWEFVPVYADTLVTRSSITNLASDVVNTIYDEHLGISWTAKMYDGNLYYVAVTNANLEVTR